MRWSGHADAQMLEWCVVSHSSVLTAQAILIGERASLIEFPSLLLPPGVSHGSVVDIRVLRNESEEQKQRKDFDALQEKILDAYGKASPSGALRASVLLTTSARAAAA